MHNRLVLVPFAALALACSDGGTGPNKFLGGTGGPTIISGDTNVSTLGFVSKSVVIDGTTYNYQVFVPASYNSVSKVPVVVFMHGGGEKGVDNDRQTRIGLGSIVRAQAATFPGLVVFPQSPPGENSGPTYIRIVAAALDQTVKHYGRADSTRLYLTGWSYGGVQGFAVAYNAPTRFAAFAPVASIINGPSLTGSASTSELAAAQLVSQTLRTLPIWQFQGSQDKTVTSARIKPQVDLLKASGANYKYTEFPNGDHQLTDLAYSHPDFWPWLWAQHR